MLVLYKTLQEEQLQYDSLRFIYDMDSDTSLPFIAQLSAEDSRIKADKNELGRGVVNAMRWGFMHAKPGPVIVMMGDNSDKLSIVPEMLKMWESGAVIVSPSRYMPGGIQHGGPWLKTLMSKAAGKFIGLLGFPTNDPTNNFKLYDGKWLASQKIESLGGFEIALELCYKAYAGGEKISQLPTEWFDRTAGESNFKLLSWLPKYLKWYFLALREVFYEKMR